AFTYSEPVVTDEDINQRLEELRERKAEYVNEDPRPVADGDHALISLESRGGLEGDPIQQDELTVEIGGSDSIEDFSTNLRGMEPGQEKEFDVTYPEEYGEARLAGKTVRFHCRLKMVRRKELPELNDEFAKDLGDFQGLDELKEAARSSLRGEREFLAQHEAKNEILEKLVDMHDIPVPESMVERQIEANIQGRMQEMVEQGADPKQLRVDWKKAREVQGERAARDIKARMLLERIADREAVEVTQDEVDREVQQVAKQQREPVAAVRRKLEEEGHLGRIVNRLRTEKTLNMLFEKSRKTAPEE
ncbi:MAG: trigger factor, partial [bacterium]|nr:trigger factor [bacterium]